jgi:hypothetical protein
MRHFEAERWKEKPRSAKETSFESKDDNSWFLSTHNKTAEFVNLWFFGQNEHENLEQIITGNQTRKGLLIKSGGLKILQYAY